MRWKGRKEAYLGESPSKSYVSGHQNIKSSFRFLTSSERSLNLEAGQIHPQNICNRLFYSSLPADFHIRSKATVGVIMKSKNHLGDILWSALLSQALRVKVGFLFCCSVVIDTVLFVSILTHRSSHQLSDSPSPWWYPFTIRFFNPTTKQTSNDNRKHL